METLHGRIGRAMVWKQHHTLMAPEYELRDGAELVAALGFRSACGSFATGRCADGSWTFKRTGFFRPEVTVRLPAAADNLAVFRDGTWKAGGLLETGGGRSFQVTTKRWQRKLEILSPAGKPLVLYENRFGILAPKRTIEIRPAAEAENDIPWLVLFGWYLRVMLESDATAALPAIVAAT